jgi:hypothetical protein
MDIQFEVQKIHSQFGTSEMANYQIQLLFDRLVKEHCQKKLLEFCDHLETYEGQEDTRFDFMLLDFNQP